jgi:hypothetical protein
VAFLIGLNIRVNNFTHPKLFLGAIVNANSINPCPLIFNILVIGATV